MLDKEAERYRMSAVPFLQRLLNDDYAMPKKNLKSLLQVNNDVISRVANLNATLNLNNFGQNGQN